MTLRRRVSFMTARRLLCRQSRRAATSSISPCLLALSSRLLLLSAR